MESARFHDSSSFVVTDHEGEIDLEYSDLDYEAMGRALDRERGNSVAGTGTGTGLPRTFLPFTHDGAKGDNYTKEFGMDGNDKMAQLDPEEQAMMEAQQRQFLEYLSQWQSKATPAVGDNDYDRFAHGLTFSPQVSTISGKEYERDVYGTKVHNKWNLFKA